MRDNRAGVSAEKVRSTLTRGGSLEGAGGIIAASAFPARGAAGLGIPVSQGATKATKGAAADITGRLARYMVEARSRSLPPKVALEGKHRILDSLGAMISGARLKPGEMAIRYIRGQGGVPEASILTTDIKASAVNAALANAMLAHADETDDVELITKTHPGSSGVAAGLAMAEREDSSGMELLRAVTLGYGAWCRLVSARRPEC